MRKMQNNRSAFQMKMIIETQRNRFSSSNNGDAILENVKRAQMRNGKTKVIKKGNEYNNRKRKG